MSLINLNSKHAKLADAEGGSLPPFNREPETSTSPGPASDRLAVIREDEKGIRSRSQSPGGTSVGSTDSKEKPGDTSKDSTYSKEREPSFRQPFPPPRKTANHPFKSKEFYALLWLAVSPSSNTRETARNEDPQRLDNDDHQEKIESFMKRLHEYMETNENTRTRIEYQNTTGKTFEDMNRVLTGLKRTNFDSEQAQSLQMRFASAAESAFQIFLPTKWRTSISSRYWGAVITILTV
ncbi:hypothetical protein N7509_000172 [Penicillium cosmopolitanum]|uniref:Uncharacterized protein n=1 Tax=Penicillium cosmopolitanum TaxID=1131564 RepID=A0A9W9WCT1_9EURO|nr:uncharacterized protein N7509_000172 [Penicillium cosmopolitanum]KAJ5414838.1 hypothetical protein N7509_000172 [Penicillium cosmopolitanum]